jgi:hypothetical protein
LHCRFSGVRRNDLLCDTQKAFVSITLFNVLGQELVTLVHRELLPGRHVIEWDAGAFSDGLYFICMKTDPYQRVIKGVLIK